MKTEKWSETYKIYEEDETGLVPNETNLVVIEYHSDGKSSLFYKAKCNIGNYSQSEIDKRLTSLAPTTKEGIEKVIKLLKKSSER